MEAAVRSPCVRSQDDVSTRSMAPSGLIAMVHRLARHLLWITLFALPAIALWWHVWSGHPSSSLTCPCGDPAQEVWFIAWPAWAIAHAANVFFSGAVNVPFGANLLSNTSGTLVGVVLSPVTWLWGPVVSTNVALTLAPALSAWGCWVALGRLVTWKPAAIPAALVYGYSSAIVSSLIFGHVSVTVLVVPPLLFATLYEIVIGQKESSVRSGAVLAGLVVIQFLISPEVLVMCAFLATLGLMVLVLVRWRQVPEYWGHAARALALGLGLSITLLAYPAWFGLSGPQSVSGVLFAIAPLSGVVFSGFLFPGPYGSFAGPYVRFGGYFGRIGPPPNFLGWGVWLSAIGGVFLARRRRIVWFLIFLIAMTMWVSLGFLLIGGPHALAHVWLPWRFFGKFPVLQEILPDQFSPFIALFFAFLVAIGLNAAHTQLQAWGRIRPARVPAWSGLLTALVGVACLVPVFVTFDMPLAVRSTSIPVWMSRDAPQLPDQTVLLTVPFAVSGSTVPMLWQAVDGMRFRLAGAALKTPNAHGGPVDQGSPGSARRILSDLTIFGTRQPTATVAELTAVRRAVRAWHVNEVVVDGPSRDPMYASGFLTAALGTAPRYVDYAWVWKIPAAGITSPALHGASLANCRTLSVHWRAHHDPLSMANCVMLTTVQP